MKPALTLLLAGLAASLALLAPAPARAVETRDCTEGCYIITCNEHVCATWLCNEMGCQLLNTFHREVSEVRPNGLSKPPRAAKPDVAHARICPAGKDCEVYELTATGATHLGSFDNVDELVQARRLLRR